MNFDRSSEPPEEPFQTSEPTPLSPASPKPLHFPAPTNIPILEMQTDVDFNQTEPHMADPAMRNTEVRPDIWRDPNEPEDHASPYSTGGEATNAMQAETAAQDAEPVQMSLAADDMGMTTNGAAGDTESALLSNDASHQSNASLEAHAASEAASAVPYASSLAHSATAVVPADPRNPGVGALLQQAQPPSALPSGASIDVHALLGTLQVPPSASSSVAPGVTPFSPTQAQPTAPAYDTSSLASPTGLGVSSPSGLPPRPPPQEQPLINSNYVHSQHIRDYHPHAAHSAFQSGQPNGAQGNVADANGRTYVPAVQHSPPVAESAVTPQIQAQTDPYSPAHGTFQHAGAQPGAPPTPTTAYLPYNHPTQAPPSTTYPVTGSTPIESRREHKLAAGEVPTAEDRPWDAETQAKYDNFIETERGFVSEGRWEQFPMGSRLFVGTRTLLGAKTRKDEVTLVDEDGAGGPSFFGRTRADGAASALGNLSSEKVTKRDIFHVFWRYGALAQISIKQAYGFVQFLNADQCKMALDAEQGKQIRDKKIHLEISKPQKNRNAAPKQNQGRRSRSPDYARGGKPAAGVDRYVSGGRDQGRGGGSGYNDKPRGYRSPSPPRGGYRDRFDDRDYRDRSPPYGRGGNGRYRSPSPKRNEDDDLPLPKRAPRDVPEVQIIVMDSLEREFIGWVEKAFSSRGVRVDVLILSPRLSEQAVIRRQIVEGVVAVVKLTKTNQSTGRIGLQVFDRSGGQGLGSVKFEEYVGLEPHVVVELVLRAKQQAQAVSAPAYGGYGGQQQQQSYGAPAMPPQQQQYGGAYGQQPPAYGQQPPTPAGYPPPGFPPQQAPPPPQNVQNLITSLDPNSLQNLLSAMGNQQHAPSAAYGGAPQSAGGYQHQQQQQAAMVALQQNPTMAAGLQAQAQAQQGGGGQGGGQVNMQDILAKLGSYRQ
ncbi:nuclear polyadenylated RNA-binding protein 3 [Teratosphaeriaceae sp. CCFEE 6253]|nr:nuclear polyadenylated RNA-binding protein 3 [Teratosphaeriaceae sp. CCFEE 6253]